MVGGHLMNEDMLCSFMMMFVVSLRSYVMEKQMQDTLSSSVADKTLGQWIVALSYMK